MNKLLPCPFCGQELDINDLDTIYPSGIVWRDDPDIGRAYYNYRDRLPNDELCWSIQCSTLTGKGCGAEIGGDSKEEAIAAWNKRISMPVD